MSTTDPPLARATLAVHAGSLADPHGGLNTPVYPSSAYAYHRDGEIRYPRYFNTPNQLAAAAKIAALEGAESALLFSSGMAAISTALLALVAPGDEVLLAAGLYGGTDHFVRHELEPRGIAIRFAPPSAADLLAALGDRSRLILVESPTNPLLNIIDLRALAAEARRRGVLTMVDNTFATPIVQQPLALGCDLVMHSATKYLGGHSDLCAGVLAGSAELIGPCREIASRYGGCLNAFDAWLLERSMKTLAVRVDKQNATAASLAPWLAADSRIDKVYYPGLKTNAGHHIASRQMTAYGAMISFNLATTLDPDAFEQHLRLIRPAVSLGGVESTICRPCLTSHAKMAPAERARLGIGDRLFRLSVGLEDIADLSADLSLALDE